MENKKELIFQDKKAIEVLANKGKYILQIINDNYNKMKRADNCLTHKSVIVATFFCPNKQCQEKERKELVDSITAVIQKQNTFTPISMIEQYVTKDVFSKLYFNDRKEFMLTIEEKNELSAKNLITFEHNGDNDYIITFVTYNPTKDKFEISKNFKDAVIEKYTYYTQNNSQAKKYQALQDIEKILKDNEITAKDINYIFYTNDKTIDKDIDLVRWLYQY